MENTSSCGPVSSPEIRARIWSQPPMAPPRATLALSARRQGAPAWNIRSAMEGPPSEAKIDGSATA